MRFRKLLVFCVALLVSACISPNITPIQSEPPNVEATTRQATIAFVDSSPLNEEDIFPYCAGVWINRTTILTALHCANGAATFARIKELPPKLRKLAPLLIHQVTDPTGFVMHYSTSSEMPELGASPTGQHDAKVVSIDPEHDLALVKAIDAVPHHGWLKLTDYLPQVGERVFIMGHPSQLQFTYMDGMIAAVRQSYPFDEDDDTAIKGPFLQIFSGVWHGNSGGPVVNQKGELIGIVSFMITHGAPNQGFAIAPPSIRRFLFRASDNHLL